MEQKHEFRGEFFFCIHCGQAADDLMRARSEGREVPCHRGLLVINNRIAERKAAKIEEAVWAAMERLT